MRNNLDNIGRESRWLCFYCHKKVVPAIAESHPLRAIIIPHPTSGGETIAHRKCADKARAADHVEAPVAAPSSFKEAAQNLRDVSALRTELGTISDLLDMAQIPTGATASDRLSFVLEDYVELRGKITDLTNRLAAADDLKSKSLVDKAFKLEAELKETKQKLTDLQLDHNRIAKQSIDGEKAVKTLAALSEVLKTVMGGHP